LLFCCHLFHIQFHQTKSVSKLSIVLMSCKVFLRIQKITGKLSSYVHGVPSVCYQRDEFIISQYILLQFLKLMKFICPLDANSVHIFNDSKFDKLKTINNAVHQFIPYVSWLSGVYKVSLKSEFNTSYGSLIRYFIIIFYNFSFSTWIKYVKLDFGS